jgi:hypothetical protein
LETQVVSDTATEIIFKMRQQYTPKVLKVSKIADGLISLSLEEDGTIKYHKDMDVVHLSIPASISSQASFGVGGTSVVGTCLRFVSHAGDVQHAAALLETSSQISSRWNEKDYSHDGFGKLVKMLNGDHLTKIA